MGKSIALVSDAGMPSICDPGEDLVKQARANCKDVMAILEAEEFLKMIATLQEMDLMDEAKTNLLIVKFIY